jgi:serine/threonine protein kinase
VRLAPPSPGSPTPRSPGASPWQEAHVATEVDSEHVVQVLSAGIDSARGVPWIAMELLKGENLAALLERSAPLDAAKTSEIFAQSGHAFAATHAAGIVHGDIRP